MTRATLEALVAQVRDRLLAFPSTHRNYGGDRGEWATDTARNLIAGLQPYLRELPEDGATADAGAAVDAVYDAARANARDAT